MCCVCSTALATDTAVPTNPTTTSPDTLDLSDGTITNPQYGCPNGTTAAQVNTSNWGTETVRFGECVNTFAITYAINLALQGSGVSIDKVHYSWRYVMCFNTPGQSCNTNISNRVNTTTGEVTDDTYFDELQVVIEITDSNGNVVETKTWNMDTWYQWNAANSYSDNEINVNGVHWQIEEGNIELYNHIDKTGTIYTPNALGGVRFRINGQDKGNWDGYYGPVVNRLQTWFTYRANPCNDTAMYDPSCPGYANAYATWEYDQNCAANALYDSGCPGFSTAYYNQQCSADPLYDSGCPGYASAYYDQQCSADPLYDSGCDGYESAYFTQQCNANPLYDSECSGYDEAYLTQQCGINTLYDSSCDGYEEAYTLAQCNENPLYAESCEGYDISYFNQQCSFDPQYDTQCPGYQAPVEETSDTGIDNGISTGDAVVDGLLVTPDLPIIDIIPTPQPIPEAQIQSVPDVPEILDIPEVTTESVIQDLNIEINESEIDNDLPEIQQDAQEEEPSGDVEQSMGGDESNEVGDASGGEELSETNEDTEGDSTEEAVEEETEEVEENTEEETTEEELSDDENIEEDTEEETNEDETTEKEENDESDEETEEEVTDAKPSKKIKLTAKQKADAKRKKIKELVTKRLKELAKTMGEANSLETQKNIQNYIIALLGFKPDFVNYNTQYPDNYYYDDRDLNQDKKVPENQRGLRNGLASEILHEKMVDEQYKGME